MVLPIQPTSINYAFSFDTSICMHMKFVKIFLASCLLYTSSTGEAIAKHILSCLKRFQLPLTNCVGQTYDGAPCISGVFNGRQAIIKRICPDAEYVHCSSHSLKLALIDSSSPHFIRNMFGIMKSVITFFNDSSQHSKILKYEIERLDNDYLVISKKERLLSLVSANTFFVRSILSHCK